MGGINESLNLKNSNTLINPIYIRRKYFIKMRSIQIRTQPEIELNQEFLLDTGTTYTLFHENIFKFFYFRVILEEFSKVVTAVGLKSENSKRNCFHFNISSTFQDQIKFLPSFYFHFENSTYEWKPENYLIPQYSPGNYFCIGIGIGKQNILGTTFFHNIQASFDLKNSQIFFTPANCSIENISN